MFTYDPFLGPLSTQILSLKSVFFRIIFWPVLKISGRTRTDVRTSVFVGQGNGTSASRNNIPRSIWNATLMEVCPGWPFVFKSSATSPSKSAWPTQLLIRRLQNHHNHIVAKLTGAWPGIFSTTRCPFFVLIGVCSLLHRQWFAAMTDSGQLLSTIYRILLINNRQV